MAAEITSAGNSAGSGTSIAILILALALIVTYAGFAVYKFNHMPRWEDGIFTVMTGIVKAVVNFFRTTPSPSQVKDEFFILSLKELNQLIERFEKLYDTPVVENFSDSGSVFTIQISAMGLQKRYEALSPSDIREKAGRLLINFYHEIRERTPSWFIPVATRDRLTIEIALSQAGEQSMRQKQDEIEARQAAQKAAQPMSNREPLTIEIDDDEDDWIEVPEDDIE